MSTRSHLPVALIQDQAVIDQGSANAEANLSVIESRVSEAAKRGAKLVLLQELHNGAYFCQHESVDEFDLAETIPGPSTERLAALAKRHDVVLVSSLFERRAAGLYHNTAVIFDADGSIAGKYRKMHIPDDPGFHEKFYFTPGDLGFAPIDTSVGRLGVLVWRSPARNCCCTRPQSVGIRTTSSRRRIVNAMPGSSVTAAMQSPMACRCCRAIASVTNLR